MRRSWTGRMLGITLAAGLGLGGMEVGSGVATAKGCASSLAPLQDLPGCNLTKTTVSGALALADSNLAGANLSKDTVSGEAALLGSELRGANLNKALIGGQNALVDSDLAGANLNGADITAVAVGVGADLAGANLNKATISGLGDLLSANLTGANLGGTTLSGTGALTGADLTGANLRGATVSGLDALFDATYAHTTCPDGTSSDADGGTCAGHLDPALRHALVGASPLVIPVGGGGCTGIAPHLVYLDSPSGAVAGASFPVSVAVEDSAGCVEVVDSSTSVSLGLGAGSPPGVLSCAHNPVTVGSGVAVFSCGVGTAGAGYTLSATGTTAGAATLGPVTSAPFDVATPPPPPPAPPGTVLSGGGLNLDGYCRSTGAAASHVPGVGKAIAYGGSNNPAGPDFAFAWDCVNAAGNAGSPISIQAACDWQYGPGTVAYLGDPNNAYTWACLSLAGAASTADFTLSGDGYYGTLPDGTTLLADGGISAGGGSLPDFVDVAPDGTLMADGSLGGSSVPDIIDTSGDGSSVTYTTPAGGFTVAGAGSLATGGAV